MSEYDKSKIRHIRNEIEEVGRRAGQCEQYCPKGDSELQTKIRRIKEDSYQVVKHIDERLGR